MLASRNGRVFGSLALLIVLATCCLAAVTYRDVLNEEWEEYKLRFGKSYPEKDKDNFRFKVFLENRHKIARHNQRRANGQKSYSIGLNQYSDMLPSEINALLNGFSPKLKKRGPLLKSRYQSAELQRHIDELEADPPVDLPKSIDWRRHGAVSPVKDQGRCGSCWAFSSTGALEGRHYLKSGNLISLSEQNLVDCSGKYGNMGCNGGLMENAFTYIRDNHGLDTENSYPYEGHDDKCRFKNKTVGADDKGYIDIPSGNERKLMQAVAKGPVSVAIDASQESFHLYKDGVYNEPRCGNSEENLDHGVLVVGYGTDPEHGDYWLVKNSWAETWGESGYIKMARNMDNQCGIATSASYPVV